MLRNSTHSRLPARLGAILFISISIFNIQLLRAQVSDPCAIECEGATAINDASCDQVLAAPEKFGKCHVCLCQEGRRKAERDKQKWEQERREAQARKETMDTYYADLKKLNEGVSEANSSEDYDHAVSLMEQAKAKVSANEYLSENEKKVQLEHYDSKIKDYQSRGEDKELRYAFPDVESGASAGSSRSGPGSSTGAEGSGENGESGESAANEEGSSSESSAGEDGDESGPGESSFLKKSRQAYNPETDPEYQRIKQEEARKREEIRLNQQRYDALKNQSHQNMQDATALSAAALLVHYYLGNMIYRIKDDSYATIYKDDAPHLRMSFGYGLSSHSLHTNFKMLERNSGGSSSENRITSRPTIDLSFNMQHWSLHSGNLALGFHLGLSAGHGFLFETYKARADVGILSRVGPLVFNAYSDFGTLRFNTWIDPTEVAEEKVTFANGKVETGFRFGSNGHDHNLLFVIQRPVQRLAGADRKLGFGGKYQGGNSNNLLFFVEFISLPVAYGTTTPPSKEDADMPFQLSLGVHNAIDWYQNSYSNNFDKRVLYETNKKKTWFATTNGKMTFGDFYADKKANPDSYLERLRPNLSFQFLIEKNIHITDGWFANVGAGATMLRRFDGTWNQEGSPVELNGNSLSAISSANLTFDFPVGVVYAFKPAASDGLAPWLAFNTEMVLRGPEMLDPGYMNSKGRHSFDSDRADAFRAEQKGFYTMVQFGAGLDNFYGLSKRLRWGIYYQFAPSSLYQNWNYRPHGLVFSLKHSI